MKKALAAVTLFTIYCLITESCSTSPAAGSSTNSTSLTVTNNSLAEGINLTLSNSQGYNFYTQTISWVASGSPQDFYFDWSPSTGSEFWANNSGEQGILDMGNYFTNLYQVIIPSTSSSSYIRSGVPVIAGYYYVAMGSSSEQNYYIIFYVNSVISNMVNINYIYEYY